MGKYWNRSVGVTMGLVMAVSAGQMIRAADVSVSTDVKSAYVFRGDTFNDGFVAQPGLEVSAMQLCEQELPVTLGVWGNLNIDDYDGAVEDGQFSEVDLYASVGIPLPVEKLALSVGYCEYIYPNTTVTATDEAGMEITVGASADREFSCTVEADVLLTPTLSLYYGVDGALEKSFYAEFGIGHSFPIQADLALDLAAKAGYLAPDEGEDGFKDLTLTASTSWKVLTVGVDYIVALDDDVLVDVADGGLYDVKVVGWVGVAQTF